MKVTREESDIRGVEGYIVSQAVFSLVGDHQLGRYFIAIKDEPDFEFVDIEKEEYDTLHKVFNIKGRE